MLKRIRNLLASSARVKIFFIFAALSFVVRTVFLALEKNEIDFSTSLIVKIYGLGLFFDALSFGYIAFIPLLYYTLISNKFFNSKAHQRLLHFFYFLLLFVLIFSCFSEWFFWDEFQTRFNFIAVDYLMYTTEVIGNILESSMGKLFSVILIASLIFFLSSYRKIVTKKTENFSSRIKKFYQITKGAHFFGDTVVAMLASFLVAAIISHIFSTSKILQEIS